MYIFLDDERNPGDVTWTKIPYSIYTIVRTYEDFVRLIESLDSPPTHISFDHDLGYGHGVPDHSVKNGNDCAQFYIEHAFNKGWHGVTFTVHSMNPVGRDKIHRTLNDLERMRNGS